MSRTSPDAEPTEAAEAAQVSQAAVSHAFQASVPAEAQAPAVIYDLTHPATDEIQLTGVFGALAEPARLTILRTVAQHGELSCTEIWERSGLGGAKSTMSHHYKVLREVGVVRMRYVGSRKYVSIRRADLDGRFPGLLNAVLGSGPEA